MAHGRLGTHQKKAREQGLSIVWIDESGFMLQPLVRRTWAPTGQTPIQYSWDRHDRLSAIAALSLSPVRQQFGLYFQLHSAHIHAPEVIAFLQLVHRHLRHKLLVVMDRYNVHRHALRLLQEVGVEWLPAYAPDLNPVELLWEHTKYGDLANFLPEDVDHLHQAVTGSMRKARPDRHLLHSFFQFTDLIL